MARCFKAMAMLLALLWGPMMSHCDLEQLPGLAFLTCGDPAESGPHQDNDCESDVCASVESGLYKTEEQQVAVLAPCLLTIAPVSALSDHSANLPPASPAPSDVSSELAPCWAFKLRQASPPRAPSASA